MIMEIAHATEVLEEAADLLKTSGWIRGEESSPKGYCALGAINQFRITDAVPTATAQMVAATLAAYALSKQQKVQSEPSFNFMADIVIWNDTVARGKRQVISTLRAAAVQLRTDAMFATQCFNEIAEYYAEIPFMKAHILRHQSTGALFPGLSAEFIDAVASYADIAAEKEAVAT